MGGFFPCPAWPGDPSPNPSSLGTQKALPSLAHSLEGGVLGSIPWKRKERWGFM